MADLEEKSKALNQTSATAPAEIQKTLPEKPKTEIVDSEKRAFVSAGEKIHKWSTYYGIDWIFNTTVGVGFAYWGKFKESGKRFWSEPLTKGFTKLLKPIIKDPVSLEKSVGKGNMFMSIIAGGMFTIPPLMLLENNKIRKSIIKFFDGMIYGKDKVENDPKFQQAYYEIEHAPKKDFWTGMTSRFAALAPLLAIVLIPKTRDVSNKIYFDHLSHGSDVIAKKIGFGPEKSFKGLPPAEAEQRWKFIHDSIAMDSGLCLPYAPLHAFFYNMFANSKGKKKKNIDEKPAETPQAPQQAVPELTNNSTEGGSTPHTNKVAAKPRDAFTPSEKFTDMAQKPSDKELQVAL
jgi:hypothetical protein